MIDILNLKKNYGNKTVLDIDSLRFEQGKAYALVGANGSGKSTLLKILSRNVTQDDGSVIMPADKMVSYMPQASYLFDMTVEHNILISVKRSERNAKNPLFVKLITRLELTEFQRKNATKLSGGETQRVALARTLMTNYNVLLLDEPTSAMDVEQAKAVIELLREETAGATLIFSTHSMRQAEALADEVIFLHNGRVTERGTPQEVLHSPATAEAKAFIDFNV